MHLNHNTLLKLFVIYLSKTIDLIAIWWYIILGEIFIIYLKEGEICSFCKSKFRFEQIHKTKFPKSSNG